MQTDKQEQDGVIEKYKQEIKDKDVENVIAGKKGDHLVKDLKRQLKMERKKNEQLQQRLQEACSENRARESKSTLGKRVFRELIRLQSHFYFPDETGGQSRIRRVDKGPSLKLNVELCLLYIISDNKVKNIIRKQKTSQKPKIWINKEDADLNGYTSILLV